MSNELTNPLQQLIKKAGKTLPATTGKVAVHQQKIDRRKGETIILADISISMASAAWGDKRKIDVLREAVTAVRSRISSRLIVFSKDAREENEIPEPEANTDLVAGLQAAKEHDPGSTLVISDGYPDNGEDSLQIARQFRGIIDVLYVGPEDDTKAIEFMRKLAESGGGNFNENDISGMEGAQKLLPSILQLLPLKQ
jgi:hypothetical protein